jgi:hypothetical protein
MRSVHCFVRFKQKYRQIFQKKTPEYLISQVFVQWESHYLIWTDGGADITRPRVALNSCFRNAPENRRTIDYISITYLIFHQTFQTAKPHSPCIQARICSKTNILKHERSIEEKETFLYDFSFY